MTSRPVGDFKIDCLANRFCYWQSEAGARYLFSQIAIDDISSFTDCVALVAIEREKHPHMHWIGLISDLSPAIFRKIDASDIPHLTFYVHLLSGTQGERERVISDLSCEPDKAACLLSA